MFSISLDEAGFSKDIIALLNSIRWDYGHSNPEKREINTVYDLAKSLYLQPSLPGSIKDADMRKIVATLKRNHLSVYGTDFLIKLRNFAREHDKEFASKMEP